MLSLVPHDRTAGVRYAEDAERLNAALEGVVALEHTGSTSVPGLRGKPTIDIVAGALTLDVSAAAHRRMESLGYRYAGDLGLPQQVFRRGTDVPWLFIVHVVEHRGRMWKDFISFRDYLRRRPDEPPDTGGSRNLSWLRATTGIAVPTRLRSSSRSSTGCVPKDTNTVNRPTGCSASRTPRRHHDRRGARPHG